MKFKIDVFMLLLISALVIGCGDVCADVQSHGYVR